MPGAVLSSGDPAVNKDACAGGMCTPVGLTGNKQTQRGREPVVTHTATHRHVPCRVLRAPFPPGQVLGLVS